VTRRNVKLVVEYDGTFFHGWQVQKNLRTVQGSLQDALRTILREDVTVRGSGRTDAGVHAWAQVANVRIESDIHVDRIRRGVNALAGEGVKVLSAEVVDDDFDSLRSACGKVYAYRLLLRRSPSALLNKRAWWLRYPMDLPLLERELATLPGYHDWNAYRAKDCTSPDPRKTIYSARIRQEEHDCVSLVFTGSGFLKQMIRILVGTAVDVGRGRLEEGSMVRIRESLERAQAGATAPPDGLFLERVLYESPER
jgi:tRNA pseudouridine38-40 synthase